MTRDYRHRAELIDTGDRRLRLARIAHRRGYLQIGIRSLAIAADCYRRAGMPGMQEQAERMLREVWGCDPAGRRWTRRMIELATAVDGITYASGRPPSWRELAAALGVTRGTVRDIAARARARGLVTWQIGQARTVKVIAGGARA